MAFRQQEAGRLGFRKTAYGENVRFPNLISLLKAEKELIGARSDAARADAVLRWLMLRDISPFASLELYDARKRVAAVAESAAGDPHKAPQALEFVEAERARFEDAKRDAAALVKSLSSRVKSEGQQLIRLSDQFSEDAFKRKHAIEVLEAELISAASTRAAYEQGSDGYHRFLDACRDLLENKPKALLRVRSLADAASAREREAAARTVDDFRGDYSIAAQDRKALFGAVEKAKNSFHELGRFFENAEAVFERHARALGVADPLMPAGHRENPVLFHNDRAAWAHLLIQNLKASPDGGESFAANGGNGDLFRRAVGSDAELQGLRALEQIRDDPWSLANPAVRAGLALVSCECIPLEGRKLLEEYAERASSAELTTRAAAEKSLPKVRELVKAAIPKQCAVIESVLGVRVNLSLGIITGQIRLIQSDDARSRRNLFESECAIEAAIARHRFEVSRMLDAAREGEPLPRGFFKTLAAKADALNDRECELYSLAREYEYNVLLRRRQEGRAYRRTFSRIADIESEFPAFKKRYAGCFEDAPAPGDARFERSLLHQAIRTAASEKSKELNWFSMFFAKPSAREEWRRDYQAKQYRHEPIPFGEHAKQAVSRFGLPTAMFGVAAAGAFLNPALLLVEIPLVALYSAGRFRGIWREPVTNPIDVAIHAAEDQTRVYQAMTSRGGAGFQYEQRSNYVKRVYGRSVDFHGRTFISHKRHDTSINVDTNAMPSWAPLPLKHAAMHLDSIGAYVEAEMRYRIYGSIISYRVIEEYFLESPFYSLYEEMADTQHRRLVGVPLDYATGQAPILATDPGETDPRQRAMGAAYSIASTPFIEKVDAGTPDSKASKGIPPRMKPLSHYSSELSIEHGSQKHGSRFLEYSREEEADALTESLEAMRPDGPQRTRLGIIAAQARHRALALSGIDDELLEASLRLDVDSDDGDASIKTYEKTEEKRAKRRGELSARRREIIAAADEYVELALLTARRARRASTPRDEARLNSLARRSSGTPAWAGGLDADVRGASDAAARMAAPLEENDATALRGAFEKLVATHHRSVRAGVRAMFEDCAAAARGEPIPLDARGEAWRGTLAKNWNAALERAVDISARLVELSEGDSSDSALLGPLEKDAKGHWRRAGSGYAAKLAALLPAVEISLDTSGKTRVGYTGCGFGPAALTISHGGTEVSARLTERGDIVPSGGASLPVSVLSDVERAVPELEGAARKAFSAEVGAASIEREAAAGKAAAYDVFVPDDAVAREYEAFLHRTFASPKDAGRLPLFEIIGGWKNRRSDSNATSQLHWSRNMGIGVKTEIEIYRLAEQLRTGGALDQKQLVRLAALNQFYSGRGATLRGILTERNVIGGGREPSSSVVDVRMVLPDPSVPGSPRGVSVRVRPLTSRPYTHSPADDALERAIIRASTRSRAEFASQLEERKKEWGFDDPALSDKAASALKDGEQARVNSFDAFAQGAVSAIHARLAFSAFGPRAKPEASLPGNLETIAGALLAAEIAERMHGVPVARPRAGLSLFPAWTDDFFSLRDQSA